MLWIYLVVLQIIFFVGLLYFLRHLMTRNIGKATRQLEELGREYAAKKEEADQIIQKAQKESKAVMARATQEVEETKEKLLKEAQEARENILKEASKKGLAITEKAERNAKFLQKEMDQKIEDRAKEKVFALLQQTVPKEFLEDIHTKWIDASKKADFDLKHLKVPEGVKEVNVVSAFSLTDQQRGDLEEKINKKLGAKAALKVDVDPLLIAGFVITIGSVVIDASLQHKIQKVMEA